jgi:hypothetical protein
MMKSLSKRYLPLLALFLGGMLVLTIRSPDVFLSPILYTEDGQWLGLAFEKGWFYAFIHAKPGYFVWGNLILLWIAEVSSSIFCRNSLVCLPQTIGIISLAFFSGVATLLFSVTRHIAPLPVRILLFTMMLLLPLGDSSNEILGRISNIGYMLVLISVLLISYREQLKSATSVRIIDVVLVISAATNPVLILLIMLYLSWQFYKSKQAKQSLQGIGRADFFLLAMTACLVATLIAYRIIFLSQSSSSGIFQPDNLIEVAIARAILYPLLFPYYTQLSNFNTIILFVGWFFFVYQAIKLSSKDISCLLPCCVNSILGADNSYAPELNATASWLQHYIPGSVFHGY